MDKSAVVNEHPDSAYTVAPGLNRDAAAAGWLSPRPERQLLVISPENGCMVGRIDRLVQEIWQHDARAEGEKDRKGDKALSKPGLSRINISAPSSLQYDSGQFDLVICAFVSAAAEITREMLYEIGRVVSSDGHVLIVDYLVPGSRLRGKKASQLRQVGNHINAWMRLRNPRHHGCLGQDAWNHRLRDAQWHTQQMTTGDAPQDFDVWADCYPPTAENRMRLRAMLVQAPEKAHGFLTPECSGDRIAFRMTELFILATVAKNTG